MVFENGVKNIQAAAYNGARTVYEISKGNTLWTLEENTFRRIYIPSILRAFSFDISYASL